MIRLLSIFLLLNASGCLNIKYNMKTKIQSSVTNIPLYASSPLPKHVAFVVDGNGRWAEARSFPRLEGHRVGAGVSVEIVKQNWLRPHDEVENIMFLLESYLKQFSNYLKENRIQLKAIGQLERLPPSVRRILDESGYQPIHDCDDANKKSNDTDTRTLCLALSYGGRDDILRACKSVTDAVQSGLITSSDIDDKLFASYTETGRLKIPDPDLILRTSGEFRLSNFLLWQSAYSEFFMVDKYWPDLTADEVETIVLRDFPRRVRRFGRSQPGPITS